VQAIWDFLDNFIYGPLNYIDRIEGLFKAAWYQDRGHRFTMLRIDKGGQYSLRQVEELLDRYGVAVYARTYDANYRYFRIKKRQARWAEYLMLHAGVKLCGPLFDERNARYVSQHPAGWMPQPWSAKNENQADLNDRSDVARQKANKDNSQAENGWQMLKKLVE